MMEKLIYILKKYKVSVYIALFIIIVGIILFSLIGSKPEAKTYESNYYIVKYDKGWSLKQKSKDKLILKHGNEAKINVEIIELNNELKYLSIEDLIDEIIYNIRKQNSSYKLISKEETTISKYEFMGYKLLFENESSQVVTSLYKKGDKIIVFYYEAKNDYFDILLDSVNNIIYHFDIKEKKYDLTHKMSFKMTDISYSKDEKLDKVLTQSNTYELASNNYYVKYRIPSNFEISDFDSTRNYFHLRGIDKKNITISTNIYKFNIFEYLDKENRVNVYKDYSMYRTSEDYSDFQETITKLDGNMDIYLYKNSYSYNKATISSEDVNKKNEKRKDENVRLIYALNKNHILIVDIKAVDTVITKKLIDSIKIEEVRNYSNYVTSKKEDNLLVSEFKRYSGQSKNKIDKVIIKIPNKYKEFEKNTNIFQEKYFGLNYDEDTNIYDYEVHYDLTPSFIKIDSKIDSINSSFSKAYGAYNYLTYFDELMLNNNKFYVYNGGYTQLGGIMFTSINRFHYYINKKVLFHELSNGGYFVVEISGNGKEITDDILNDVTNFQIKEISK